MRTCDCYLNNRSAGLLFLPVVRVRPLASAERIDISRWKPRASVLARLQIKRITSLSERAVVNQSASSSSDRNGVPSLRPQGRSDTSFYGWCDSNPMPRNLAKSNFMHLSPRIGLFTRVPKPYQDGCRPDRNHHDDDDDDDV